MTPEEFTRFVQSYRDRALSLAIRLVKDSALAEDAVQDAFMKAYRQLSSFRGDAEVSTWFYRIVYTTCLNVLRKERRMPRFESLPEEETFVGMDAGIVESIDQEDLLKAVDSILEDMAPLYAVVLDLFYVKDCGYDEIVKVTGMPLGTVKTRLNRGRKMLKDALEVESLWKTIGDKALKLGLADKQSTAHMLESLVELRSISSVHTDCETSLCQLSLQPLPSRKTKVRPSTKAVVEWQGRSFTACAANFLANKCAFYSVEGV